MVRLAFWASTGSWIIGRALAKTNPQAQYSEADIHQYVEGDRIEADMEKLNEAIRGTPLIGAAPEDYLLTAEDFRKLKDWLRKGEKVESETETKIVIVG